MALIERDRRTGTRLPGRPKLEAEARKFHRRPPWPRAASTAIDPEVLDGTSLAALSGEATCSRVCSPQMTRENRDALVLRERPRQGHLTGGEESDEASLTDPHSDPARPPPRGQVEAAWVGPEAGQSPVHDLGGRPDTTRKLVDSYEERCIDYAPSAAFRASRRGRRLAVYRERWKWAAATGSGTGFFPCSKT